MRKTTLLAASALLVASAGLAAAQTRSTNPTNEPPGQRLNERGPVAGQPGASGYAPGHQPRTGKAPGASGSAPGHAPAPATRTTR